MSESFDASSAFSKSLRLAALPASSLSRVQAHFLKARIVQIGQGLRPEVRGVQDQHRAGCFAHRPSTQIGQKIHEALEDPQKGCAGLVGSTPSRRTITPRPGALSRGSPRHVQNITVPQTQKGRLGRKLPTQTSHKYINSLGQKRLPCFIRRSMRKILPTYNRRLALEKMPQDLTGR